MRVWLAIVMLMVLLPIGAAQPSPLTAEQHVWLRDHGTIRIGLADNSLPSSAADANGTFRGFGPDLLHLAALKAGVEIDFVAVSGQNAVEALRNGSIDLLGSYPARPDLEEFAAAGQAYATVPFVFVAVGLPQFLSGADITGPVATREGVFGTQLLAAEFPDLDVAVVPSHAAGLQGLVAGDFVAYFGPLAAIGYEAQQARVDIQPVGAPVAAASLHVWGRTSESEALEIMEVGRARMTDAERAIIHVKWTGFDLTEPTTAATRDVVPLWVAWLGLALTAAAVLSMAIALFLRQRIKHATAELQQLNHELEGRIRDRMKALDSQATLLADSNEQLERFAYVASHDLQAPLRQVGSFADMLESELGDRMSGEERQMLEAIQSGITRMRERIRALLRFSQAHGRAVERAPVALADVVGEVVDDFASTIATEGAEVTWGDLPVIVGDHALLAEVFQNLIANSLRYRREVPPRIDISSTREDAFWRIDIKDNGQGFDERHADRIFGMFKRLHSDDDGAGIGLALVRLIVTKHGGSIEAHGVIGEGALFSVRLPVDGAGHQATSKP